MKGWKGYIAVFLLAILSVSIVPKAFWHDCDHAHADSFDGKAGNLKVESECAVCDYNFSAADVGPGFAIRASAPSVKAYSEFGPAILFLTSPSAQHLRGPPHC